VRKPVYDKALASGASKVHIVDLTKEFLEEYVWPTLKAGAVYEGKYLLGTSFARPVIAKALVDIAKREGADAIAHGATGKGNDQVRFETGVFSLDPTLKILAPWRLWDISSREDAIDYVLNGGSSGAFPYGAGIRYEATKEGTLGTRVKKIEVFDFKANKWVPIDAKKTYMLAVNSYIAKGKDGYTTLGKITSQKRGRDTHLSDTKIFIDYLKEKKEIGKPKSTNVIFKY